MTLPFVGMQQHLVRQIGPAWICIFTVFILTLHPFCLAPPQMAQHSPFVPLPCRPISAIHGMMVPAVGPLVSATTPTLTVLFRHPGHIYFSFSHTVLRWFSSYLTGRIQSVTIGNTTSSSQRLEFGVPQGLMIGPLLFTQFISAHNLDVCSKQMTLNST